MDFPNIDLEAVGVGLFRCTTLGVLEVGAGVEVLKFPWNGLSPICVGGN